MGSLTVHRSSLNPESVAPLVRLLDAANKREKLFYFLQRYLNWDGRWHFVALSFDSLIEQGIVVLDDYVEQFPPRGCCL